MSQGFDYALPALRGTQAGHEYFVAMCPLRLLPRLFIFDDDEIPAELRAQRTLNQARVPEIRDYITDNRDSYAFSAITASIDGDAHFEVSSHHESLGTLKIPMTSRFILNDGQHRRAAIEAALELSPELGEETIAVVFFLDKGLQRSQQLFADLNKHAVKPTKSLGVLYDHRDPTAVLARELAQDVRPFRGLTEMERTTISNRSLALFTLSAVYQATLALLGKRKGDDVSERDRAFAGEFWESMTNIIPEWRMASERSIRSSELRRDYVHAHGVTLQAIGLAGHRLHEKHPSSWKPILEKLTELDWRRSNVTTWEGRAMTGGHMSKARQNVQLTAAFLMDVLDVLPEGEQPRIFSELPKPTRNLEPTGKDINHE